MSVVNLRNKFGIRRYDGKKLFMIFSVTLTALIIDSLISPLADNVIEQATSFWGIVLFVSIAVIYMVGQYLILELVKAKIKESKIKASNILALKNLVTIAQYILTAIMLIVVIEILATNSYYTNLLTIAIVIGYGMTTLLMSVLAFQLFSWFKTKKSLVVLLYGLAAIMIIVNAVDSIVLNVVPLLGKPSMVTPKSEVIFETGYNPGTIMSVVTFLQSNSVLGYIILTWAGSIFLLRHHIQRVGRIKFWFLVILPLALFASFNISYFQGAYPNNPVTTITPSNLMLPFIVIVLSTTVCGILFGAGFWSIAKFVSHTSNVRDYMIITGCGFALFFTAADAGLLQAGYPPFGLADVSFVGLSSFIILVGLYQSAISVAHDVQLRKSIKTSVMNESKLLDSIGTAQMTQETENRLMKMTRQVADVLTEESGVQPSLTDVEIKEYLHEVIAEVKISK